MEIENPSKEELDKILADRANTLSVLTVPVQPGQRGVDEMPVGREVSWIKIF